MYLLFKTVSDQQLGIVKRAGHYLDYVLGFLDDSVKELVDISHLKATVISDTDVALAWKFAGNYSGYLSVKANTLPEEQLQFLSSMEDETIKAKYYLTDADKNNATKFMKIAMRKIVDEVYDKRLKEIDATSQLETTSWAQQRAEAEAYAVDNSSPTPMLTALATARAITTAEMVSKVSTAIDAYNTSIVTMLANKQIIEAKIKNCANLAECNVLLHTNFGYNMPANQQKDLNFTDGAVYNI
jgi:hypothetical protein